MVEPFAGAEGVRAEVTDHAPVRAGHGVIAPGRHAVQNQPMCEEGFAWTGMDLHASTA